MEDKSTKNIRDEEDISLVLSQLQARGFSSFFNHPECPFSNIKQVDDALKQLEHEFIKVCMPKKIRHKSVRRNKAERKVGLNSSFTKNKIKKDRQSVSSEKEIRTDSRKFEDSKCLSSTSYKTLNYLENQAAFNGSGDTRELCAVDNDGKRYSLKIEVFATVKLEPEHVRKSNQCKSIRNSLSNFDGYKGDGCIKSIKSFLKPRKASEIQIKECCTDFKSVTGRKKYSPVSFNYRSTICRPCPGYTYNATGLTNSVDSECDKGHLKSNNIGEMLTKDQHVSSKSESDIFMYIQNDSEKISDNSNSVVFKDIEVKASDYEEAKIKEISQLTADKSIPNSECNPDFVQPFQIETDPIENKNLSELLLTTKGHLVSRSESSILIDFEQSNKLSHISADNISLNGNMKNIISNQQTATNRHNKCCVKLAANCNKSSIFVDKVHEAESDFKFKRTLFNKTEKNLLKKTDCLSGNLNHINKAKKIIYADKEENFVYEKETCTDDLMKAKKFYKDVGTCSRYFVAKQPGDEGANEISDVEIATCLDKLRDINIKTIQSKVASKTMSTNISQIHSIDSRDVVNENVALKPGVLRSVDRESRTEIKRFGDYRIRWKVGQKFKKKERFVDSERRWVTRKEKERRKSNDICRRRIDLFLDKAKEHAHCQKISKVEINKNDGRAQQMTDEYRSRDKNQSSVESPKLSNKHIISEYETKFVKGWFARQSSSGKNKISVKRRAFSNLEYKYFSFKSTRQKKSLVGLKTKTPSWERSSSPSEENFSSGEFTPSNGHPSDKNLPKD